MKKHQNVDYRSKRLTRLLSSTALALLLSIAVVHLWPKTHSAPTEIDEVMGSGDPIEIEIIEQTVQAARKPPPPSPLPPIEVPNDIELVEEEFEPDEEIGVADDSAPVEVEGEEAAGPDFVRNADVPPRAFKIVEPKLTAEARKERITARVVVQVRVDKRGRVKEASIVDRFIKERDEAFLPVTDLGFGIDESALNAARGWRFIPAKHGGRAVESLQTIPFEMSWK